MANKSCEEILNDCHDSSSITSTPSRSVSDSDHTSSTISTKASGSNQIAEHSIDKSFDMDINQTSDSMTNNPTINKNVDKSSEEYLTDTNNKPKITATSSKIINDPGDNNKKTILTISSCRKLKPEFFLAFDDLSSPVDYILQSPTKITQKHSLEEDTDKFLNIDITTDHGDFYTQKSQTLETKNSNQQINVYGTYMSMEGQEKIDFLEQFTKIKNAGPILEQIMSYLSYKDIASMMSVSNIWHSAIINSPVAQQKLENIFTQVILYFCNANVNVSEEYKCLFETILFDLKKHLQFNQETPVPNDF